MRYVLLTLTVFVLLACQVPLMGLMGAGAFTLDLPLIAVMYLAATSRPLGGFVTAVLFGLLADSFSPGAVLGTHMEIMGLLFLANLALAQDAGIDGYLHYGVDGEISAEGNDHLLLNGNARRDRDGLVETIIVVKALPIEIVEGGDGAVERTGDGQRRAAGGGVEQHREILQCVGTGIGIIGIIGGDAGRAKIDPQAGIADDRKAGFVRFAPGVSIVEIKL